MKRTQINARIPAEEAIRTKKDILDTGATLEAYVREALLHFRRTLTVEQRRGKFSEVRKGSGRAVAV